MVWVKRQDGDNFRNPISIKGIYPDKYIELAADDPDLEAIEEDSEREILKSYPGVDEPITIGEQPNPTPSKPTKKGK